MIKSAKTGFILFCLYLFISINLNAQHPEFVPGVVMVKMEKENATAISQKIGKKGIRSTSKADYIQLGTNELDATLRKAKATELKRLIPYNPRFEKRHAAKGLDQWFEITIDSETDVKAVVEELNLQPGVVTAEPMPYIIPASVEAEVEYPVNDTYIKRQWNYHNTGTNPLLGGVPGGVKGTDINLFDAWKITMGTPNVVIAIIDGGLDITHPDIKPNLWINEAELNGLPSTDDDNNGYIDDIHGYDFVYDRLNLEASDHGTHVGGIVAAKADNGIGIAGVAGGKGTNDGVRLMSCQILDKEGKNGRPAEAFIYAADNGAVIAQCSWSLSVPNVKNQAVLDAIDYFIEFAGKDENGDPLPGTPMAGGIVIFAAGNSNANNLYYPPSYEKCFSVAAINIDNKKANYSNYAEWISISAPGGAEVSSVNANFGQIFSTVPGGNVNTGAYDNMSGTSMACPHVSGVAGLILSKYGNEKYTPEMLKQRLLHTSSDVYGHDPDYEGLLGAGMVDAYAALATKIPDVEANVYFGEFALENDKIYEHSLKILNVNEEEIIITGITLSNPDFTIPDFTPGQKLAPGELVELTVKFAPSQVQLYQETVTITYEGAFSDQTTTTYLHANVKAEEKYKITLLYEDFEKPLSGWEKIDNDGDGSNWIVQSNLVGTFAHSGNYFIVSASNTSSGEKLSPDNWLITPEIDLTEMPENTNALLSYWVRPISGIFSGDHYRVVVSTSPEKAFNSNDFSHELLEETISLSPYNEGYTQQEINLNEFAGKKIKIAFVHTKQSDGFWLILDDIEVCLRPQEDFIDVEVIKESIVGYELTANDSYPVRVKVANNGKIAAENIKVSYQWDGVTEPVVETIPYIAASDTIIYTFTKETTTPEEIGLHTLILSVDQDNDIYQTNNRWLLEIWINPYHSLYFWDFENATLPNEFYKFTYDINKVSDDLAYTAWGTRWGGEEFLLAKFPYPISPIMGYACFASSSYFSPPGQADRWLVIAMPAIETENMRFKWDAISYDPAAVEDYEVLISTKGTFTDDPKNPNKQKLSIDPNDFTVLKAVTGESTELTRHLLDISEYAGEPFYLAFRHTTNQGIILVIDNVRIMTPEAEKPADQIQENTENREIIHVYPNPASDLLTIESEDSINQVELVDLSGKLIYKEVAFGKQSHTIQVSDYASGIYLLRVSTANGQYLKKVIINN